MAVRVAHAGHVLIPSDKGVPKEKHLHKCVLRWCQQMVLEDNAVCGKQLHGTGLEWHSFPCMQHIHAWRTQWGIDDLLDTLLEPQQAQRFVHEYPSAKLQEREQQEIVQGNTDLEVVHKEPC